MKKSEEEIRAEMIEKAQKYIDLFAIQNQSSVAWLRGLLADFALQIESERKTFTVKALRKKGTTVWYWYDGNWYLLAFPENQSNSITMDEIKEYYKYAEPPLPEDAELVTLKIEIIEP